MLDRLLRRKPASTELAGSELFNENTFYPSFMKDLKKCKSDLLVESPFITSNRIASLLPIFIKMRSRNIRVVINTRHPSEHEAPYDRQSWAAVDRMQQMGIEVLFTGAIHRKIAIIDKEILWEGSLNILSQNNSCEVMRRIKSIRLATEMLQFIQVDKYLSW